MAVRTPVEGPNAFVPEYTVRDFQSIGPVTFDP